jgi:predicted transcriptional regulator
MKLADIEKILRAQIVPGGHQKDIVLQAGAGSDLMSDLLRGPLTDVLVLTGLNNIQVIRTCVIAGVAAVVLVRGKVPDEEMVSLARENGMPLLTTPFTMYTACGRLFRAGLRGVDKKA